MSLDSQNWAKQLGRDLAKEAGDVVSNAIDPIKTAEAIAIISKSGLSNVGGTGLSGAEYVASRGGINAQGYYNDVPAYQQLTANEYKQVTINNPGGYNHGHIDTMAMLALLNKKEAEHNAKMGKVPRNDGVLSGGPLSSASITATPPSPDITPMMAFYSPPPPVKTATVDIILFDDETTPIDTMEDLIFENIGGQELINITRSDIVNGQKISYQPIKNLSSIQQRYNSNTILSLQQTADKYFAGFSIKLEDKIPNEGNGVNGENVYIEESTGDLIIEFININNDEQIEVQITTDGTIYEADLGEIAS